MTAREQIAAPVPPTVELRAGGGDPTPPPPALTADELRWLRWARAQRAWRVVRKERGETE